MKDARTRQLGGMAAAHNRAKQRIKELEGQVDELKALNGELCAEVNEKAARISELERDDADLGDIVAEVAALPEGKSAMFCMSRAWDGGLTWGGEVFDFASYVLVDRGADTVTGKLLCDPFCKADSGDELTVAGILRDYSASLEGEGDTLGVIGLQQERIEDLEDENRKLRERMASFGLEVEHAVG